MPKNIFVGSNQVTNNDALNVGGQQVQSVYVGGTLVWELVPPGILAPNRINSTSIIYTHLLNYSLEIQPELIVNINQIFNTDVDLDVDFIASKALVFEPSISNVTFANDFLFVTSPGVNSGNIIAINGDPAPINDRTIRLDSGANLYMHSSGQFIYDPDEAYLHLDPGEVEEDTFSYTYGSILYNTGNLSSYPGTTFSSPTCLTNNANGSYTVSCSSIDDITSTEINWSGAGSLPPADYVVTNNSQLTTAAAAAQPGDIIEIASTATISGKFYFAPGTAANPITIRGETGHQITGDGTGFYPQGWGDNYQTGLETDPSYHIYQDLNFYNQSDSGATQDRGVACIHMGLNDIARRITINGCCVGVIFRGNNTVLQDFTITNVNGGFAHWCWAWGGTGADVTNVTVERGVISNVNTLQQVSVSYSGSHKFLHTDGCTFRDLSFTNIYGPAIWFDSRNHNYTIQRIRVDGVHTPSNANWWDIPALYLAEINDITNAVCEDLYVANADGGAFAVRECQAVTIRRTEAWNVRHCFDMRYVTGRGTNNFPKDISFTECESNATNLLYCSGDGWGDVIYSPPGTLANIVMDNCIFPSGAASSGSNPYGGKTLAQLTSDYGWFTNSHSGLGVATPTAPDFTVPGGGSGGSPGSAYEIKYTVVQTQAGALNVRLVGDTITYTQSSDGSGTFTRLLAAPANAKYIQFGRVATFRGTISNIEIREVDLTTNEKSFPIQVRASELVGANRHSFGEFTGSGWTQVSGSYVHTPGDVTATSKGITDYDADDVYEVGFKVTNSTAGSVTLSILYNVEGGGEPIPGGQPFSDAFLLSAFGPRQPGEGEDGGGVGTDAFSSAFQANAFTSIDGHAPTGPSGDAFSAAYKDTAFGASTSVPVPPDPPTGTEEQVITTKTGNATFVAYFRVPEFPQSINFTPTTDFDGSLGPIYVRKLLTNPVALFPTFSATPNVGTNTADISWDYLPHGIDSVPTTQAVYEETGSLDFNEEYGVRGTDIASWWVHDGVAANKRYGVSLLYPQFLTVENVTITGPWSEIPTEKFQGGIITSVLQDWNTPTIYVRNTSVDYGQASNGGNYTNSDGDGVLTNRQSAFAQHNIFLSNVTLANNSDANFDNRASAWMNNCTTSGASNRSLRVWDFSEINAASCAFSKGTDSACWIADHESRLRLWNTTFNGVEYDTPEAVYASGAVTINPSELTSSDLNEVIYFNKTVPRIPGYIKYDVTDLEFEYSVFGSGEWESLAVSDVGLPSPKGSFSRTVTLPDIGVYSLRMRTRNGNLSSAWTSPVLIDLSGVSNNVSLEATARGYAVTPQVASINIDIGVSLSLTATARSYVVTGQTATVTSNPIDVSLEATASSYSVAGQTAQDNVTSGSLAYDFTTLTDVQVSEDWAIIPEVPGSENWAQDNANISAQGMILTAQGNLNVTRQRYGVQVRTKAYLGPGSFRYTTSYITPGVGAVWAPWTYLYDWNFGISEINDEIDWESPSGPNYQTAPTNQNYARANSWRDYYLSSGAIVNLSSYDLTTPTEWRIDWYTNPAKVEWYINGNLIRTTTNAIPTRKQQAYMSFWFASWGGSYDFDEREVRVTNFTYTPFVGQTALEPSESSLAWTFGFLPFTHDEQVQDYTFIATQSGFLTSTNANSALYRDGTNLTGGLAPNSTTYNYLSDGLSGGVYYADQILLEFDTSSLPDGAVIDSAIISMRNSSTHSGNVRSVALFNDWGTTITTADWLTPAVAQAKPLAGTLDSVAAHTTTNVYPNWVIPASNYSQINTTGFTRIQIVHKDTYENTSFPTRSYSNHRNHLDTTYKPQLRVRIRLPYP